MIGRLRRVAEWPRSQRVARLVVLLGPLVALVAAAPAGYAPAPWLVGLTVLLGTLAAAAPESEALLFATVVVVGWWCLAPGATLHVAVLPASAALLAAHLAALVAAYGPPDIAVDPQVLRLWLRRGSLVLLAAPVLLLLALVLVEQEPVSGMWPAGLATAVLVLIAASAAFAEVERDR